MLVKSYRTLLSIFLIATVTLLFFSNSTSSPTHLVGVKSPSKSYVPPFSLHKRHPNTLETHTYPQTQTQEQQHPKDPFESIQSLECQNGGIGFNGACVSPASFSESWEDSTFSYLYPYPDLAPKQLNLSECSVDLNSICSWRRSAVQAIKRENCQTQLPPHTSSLNEFINALFSVYGPWSENDKRMLQYLLGNSSNPGPLRHYNEVNSSKKAYKVPHHLPEADTNIYLTPRSFSPTHTQTARLAFVIMVHIDVPRLELLLSTIWHSRNLYVVHLDSKLNEQQVALAQKIISKYAVGPTPNIQLLSDRFDGTWGGISLVYMNLAGIIKLLEMNRGSEPWTHVINLSVYDMNTKPIYRLSEFLSMDVHKHRNMLVLERRSREARHTEFYTSCGKVGVQITMDDLSLCGGELCVLTPPTYLEPPSQQTLISNWMYTLPSEDMKYIEGSQWNFLTRDFVLWLVSDFKAIEILFSFKNTYIPDESYFQTAIYNSPFKHTIMNNNFRWTDWKKNLKVDMEDVQNLKWGHHFFIRKVKDPLVAEGIINEVYPLWGYTQ